MTDNLFVRAREEVPVREEKSYADIRRERLAPYRNEILEYYKTVEFNRNTGLEKIKTQSYDV